MKDLIVSVLVLLYLPASASPQTTPADWKIIQDAKGLCQVAIPPDWFPLTGSAGAAVLQDPTTGIVVVTSQPGQEFKPFTPAFLKTMAVPKDKMFENSAVRIFYQHKVAADKYDTNAFSSSVPAKVGTCSCHVTVGPVVPVEIARKIALSLSPVPAKT